MTPTPLQRALAAIPPVIVLACAFSTVADVVLTVWQARSDRGHDTDAMLATYTRIGLLSTAAWITTNAMFAVGMHEVARRVTLRDRGLITAAAVLLWIVTARSLSTIYLQYLTDAKPDDWRRWTLWGSRVTAAAWLGVCGLLAIALRRRPPLVVIVLAVGLLVTTLLAHPPHMLRSWFYFDGWDHKAAARNGALGAGYGMAQALVVMTAIFQLADGAPPASGDTHRIASGIGRVGAALVARIVIAMGFAAVTLMAVGAKSPGLFKASLVLVPTAILIAMIAMITGLFQAGGSAGTLAVPRYRFGFAAACTLLYLTMSSMQAIAAYRLVQAMTGDGDVGRYDRDELLVTAAAFPYLGPAIALAGMVALVSALAELRRQRPDQLGSAEPAIAGALIVGCSIAAALVQHWAEGKRADTGSYLLLIILFSVASIVGQLAVARLCHKVGDGLLLEVPSGLPPARVHNPEE